jgi:hypothetical protein
MGERMKKDPTLKGIMPPSERNAMIYNLRESGESAKAIAKKFDLSVSRIYLIHSQIKYVKDNFNGWSPLRQRLSKRTKTVLLSAFGDTILDNPQILVQIGWQGLFKTKNVGLYTAREICDVLRNIGITDSKNR